MLPKGRSLIEVAFTPKIMGVALHRFHHPIPRSLGNSAIDLPFWDRPGSMRLTNLRSCGRSTRCPITCRRGKTVSPCYEMVEVASRPARRFVRVADARKSKSQTVAKSSGLRGSCRGERLDNSLASRLC